MPSWTESEVDIPVASPDVRTLGDLLTDRLQRSADRVLYRFTGEQPDFLTVGTVAARANAIAARLATVTRPGDRVLLLYHSDLEFVPALFGTILAGRIAVPAPLPDPDRPRVGLSRLHAVADDARPAVVLTRSEVPRTSSAVLDAVPWIATDDLTAIKEPLAVGGSALDPDGAVWLQYTSGSTGAARGVVITHANALANCREIDEAYTFDEDSVIVSWVPTHHDLGLIYGVLMPMYAGCVCVSMAPTTFVQRPARWLELASEVGATHTVSPNFGFDLVAKRGPTVGENGLDLSKLKVVLNGGEPIRRRTEQQLAELLRGTGFDPAAFSHSYGMAETTAKITAELPGRRGRFAWLDRAALERGVIRDADSPERGVAVAGNGVTAGGTEVAIVDPETCARAAPDTVGEIWISGPCVGRGYWSRPAETEASFGGRIREEGDRSWLRTGDLGFVRDGELYVSGRRKDLIIVRGENHHPHDIEWSAKECHPAIRQGSLVAFAVDTDDGEALGLVAEVYTERVGDPEGVFGALRDAIGGHGLAAAVLALVPPGTLEKTSSGKPRRQEVRRLLAEGALPIFARFDTTAADRSVLDGVDLPGVLRAARDADRPGVLVLHVRHLVSGMLGVSLQAVDGTRPLKELGLDSITQIEVIEQLASRLGIDLPGSTVRDHPTLAAIAKAALQRFH